MKVLAGIQRLPLASQPFKEIGEGLGMSEGEVMDACRSLMEKGAVKRLGASISHGRVGFTANPMTVAKVPEDRIDEAGEAIAGNPEVTHCYARSGWDYNLFFMIHGRDRAEAEARAGEIVAAAGGFEHRCLFSVRELKKTSFEIRAEGDG